MPQASTALLHALGVTLLLLILACMCHTTVLDDFSLTAQSCPLWGACRRNQLLEATIRVTPSFPLGSLASASRALS